jgi:hypothetical protein
MNRKLVAWLAVSLVVSLVALGWVAWVALQPRHWFAAAYAVQGPPGEQGPRGTAGMVSNFYSSR